MDYPLNTELDAVNTALINMGEAPVNSLEGDLPLDAQKAYETLKEVSLKVQTRGWFWNQEIMTLGPDVDGYISLPANTLDVKATMTREVVRVHQGRLYRIAPNNNGLIWDGPRELKITFALSFDLIPVIARQYIGSRTSRIFQARELGDEMLLRNDTAEERDLLAIMRAEDNEHAKRTLKSSKSVSMITNRWGPVLL